MATTSTQLALASLEAMRRTGVRFALLHGRDRLFRGAVSDVDVTVDRAPELVIRLASQAWNTRGLVPVIVWPYDIGGTSTIFLATPDARDGVQLDLLYDRYAEGRYGVRSPALLSTADPTEPLPVVSDAGTLIYQWRKRSVKRQDSRLAELQKEAFKLDRDVLLAASNALTGSTETAHRILGGTRSPPSFLLQSKPTKRLARLVRRVSNPIGFWVHVSQKADADELAHRFSRFLVRAEVGETPPRARQPGWWATTVMPVRLRPGIFLSYGPTPRWPRSDLALSEGSLDDLARRVTDAMAERIDRCVS